MGAACLLPSLALPTRPPPPARRRSTKFAGEGSAACLLGLLVGAALLLARRLFPVEVLQEMLEFTPENFFV